MSHTIPEVLNAAADHTERRGWTAGASGWNYDGNAPVCLEGALQAASGLIGHHNALAEDWEDDCPAYRAVQEYLDTAEPLWKWNDAGVVASADGSYVRIPDRTAADVVAVLRAAALTVAAREAEAVRA